MTNPNDPRNPFEPSRDPGPANLFTPLQPQAPHLEYGGEDTSRDRGRVVSGGPIMSARRELRMKHSKLRRNLLIAISILIGLLLALIATDTIKIGTGPTPTLSQSVQSIATTPTRTADVGGINTESIREPTHVNPLRVYIGGDSLVGSFGLLLGTELGNSGVITAAYDSRPSSGLINTDFYNWKSHARSIMQTQNPEIVIFMIGTNDASIVSAKPKSYVTDYSEKLNDVIDIFAPENHKVFFVLAPAMKDSRLNKNVAKLNDVISSVTISRNVHIIDSGDSLSPAGAFSLQLLEHSKYVTVRTDDGVHIAPAGGQLLTQQISQALEKYFSLSRFSSPLIIKPVKVAGCCTAIKPYVYSETASSSSTSTSSTPSTSATSSTTAPSSSTTAPSAPTS